MVLTWIWSCQLLPKLQVRGGSCIDGEPSRPEDIRCMPHWKRIAGLLVQTWIFLSWWSSSTSGLLVWSKLKFNMGLPGTPQSIDFVFAGKSVKLIRWKSVSQSEDLALSTRSARVNFGRGSTTRDTELKATGVLAAVRNSTSWKFSCLLSKTGPEMSCYHSSRSGLNLVWSSTLTVGSRMTQLSKRAILIWRLTTAFSSPIQKLVPTPTALRMSRGMLSRPNFHMVQSMPMCSHTWPSIYGGGSFRTRTTSSRFSILWNILSITTPGMYQGSCNKHLLALIMATKSFRKNSTSQLWYQKPKEFFKVTPKNQNILICPLVIHCQSTYNSKFVIDSLRCSILNNMLFDNIHCKS